MEALSLKNERPYVLTIDDDPDFNNLLSLMLKKLAVEVVTTDGPESFFQTFVKRKPTLCLVDIHLGKNYNAGFELIKLLRKQNYKDLPIIVISSVKNKDEITKALDLGADDYLTKPIERVLLAEKVRHFVEVDRYSYDPFKMFPVADRFNELEINFQFEIIKIGPEKISLKSNAYFAPETFITIDEASFAPFTHSGDGKIQLQVLQNRKIEDEKCFELICRICQGEREEDLKKNIRRWLFFR